MQPSAIRTHSVRRREASGCSSSSSSDPRRFRRCVSGRARPPDRCIRKKAHTHRQTGERKQGEFFNNGTHIARCTLYYYKSYRNTPRAIGDRIV
uniref:Uncharacterized protein n=1 Tax=Trichogramma kaykai TaxID=54128 RepID=A0ABD2XIN9_9HYME